ncbi:MAG: hypothetical protein AB1394_07080 [Bacteroidota bacterium]
MPELLNPLAGSALGRQFYNVKEYSAKRQSLISFSVPWHLAAITNIVETALP